MARSFSGWRGSLLRGGLFAVLLALAPYVVEAHVKWFADTRAHPMRTYSDPE